MITSALSFEQAFVGVCQVGLAAAYTGQFVRYLRPRGSEILVAPQLEESERDRAVNRIAAGVNAIGGIARLFDWVLDQKWIRTVAAQAVALKMIAHVAGVFYYLKNSLDVLGEIERLNFPEERGLAYDFSTTDSLNVYRYSKWIEFFSNIFLGIYSGVQLGIVITGAVIMTPSVQGMVLAAGLVCLIASTTLRFGSTTGIEKLPFLNMLSNWGFSYHA